MKKAIIIFISFIILTPLGLLAPGSTWGEWGISEIKSKIGFIPRGMSRFHAVIRNILPGYSIPGFDRNFWQSALGYVLAAIVGTAAILVVFWLMTRLLPEKKANP